jgi:hypothetical protein
MRKEGITASFQCSLQDELRNRERFHPRFLEITGLDEGWTPFVKFCQDPTGHTAQVLPVPQALPRHTAGIGTESKGSTFLPDMTRIHTARFEQSFDRVLGR